MMQFYITGLVVCQYEAEVTSTNKLSYGYYRKHAMHKYTTGLHGRIFRLGLILLVLSLGWVAASADSGWQRVADGVEYRPFTLAGPVRAFVVRMQLDNPEIVLEAGLAHGMVGDGFETVSAIANRYEGTINTWNGYWGTRSDVLVAINGSYYDLETGVAEDGVIQSGWYASQFNDLGGTSGLAWKRDRSLFIGSCVYHRDGTQFVHNVTEGTHLSIDGVNREVRKGEIALLTPQFGTRSFGGNRTEVLIEMTQPAGFLPGSKSSIGIVRALHEHGGPFTIPFDHVVLSARGDRRAALREAMNIGDVVGIELEVTHLNDDCKGSNSDSWADVYTSVAGNWVFLRQGAVLLDDDRGATIRNPRTALCYNATYLYFVVVDGRDDAYSIGMTIPELADFCQERLNADWGVNMDGGGSSTLWVDGRVKNNPSDGRERGVANALMIVRVEPKELSGQFATGQPVESRYPTNVHLGPGLNYAPIASVDTGASGSITFHMNQLNGILAAGANWWKVDFGGLVGWVDEAALTAKD